MLLRYAFLPRNHRDVLICRTSNLSKRVCGNAREIPPSGRAAASPPAAEAGNVCERPQHGALYNSVTPAGGGSCGCLSTAGWLFRAPLPGLLGAAHAFPPSQGLRCPFSSLPPSPLPASALARGEDQSEGKQAPLGERSSTLSLPPKRRKAAKGGF